MLKLLVIDIRKPQVIVDANEVSVFRRCLLLEIIEYLDFEALSPLKPKLDMTCILGAILLLRKKNSGWMGKYSKMLIITYLHYVNKQIHASFCS